MYMRGCRRMEGVQQCHTVKFAWCINFPKISQQADGCNCNWCKYKTIQRNSLFFGIFQHDMMEKIGCLVLMDSSDVKIRLAAARMHKANLLMFVNAKYYLATIVQ